ncbi:GIN domain-containing protein [Phenylobacterium sp.]|uniref:GIN domain-containing protein n=1 Tax=Phenylobacterium sp. TaxID=1871053 RepID=UPI0035AEF4E7
MIRPLLMIAGAGFLLSVVTLSTAVAIGGPEAIARGAWSSWDWDWDDHDRHGRHGRHDGMGDGALGPQTTRELAWTGADTLDLDVAADVVYTQAPGPAKLTITGPQRAVERVEIGDDGRISYDGFRHGRGRLQIVMTAPGVTRFRLSGSDQLTINDYRQDRLALELSGDSEVEARGEARALELDISGSGEADLGALKTVEAKVDISGSGEARIAPTEAADLDISGSGDITLLTRPARVTSDISGSGTVRQEPAEAPAAAT